jgi:hypothetical protein
MNCITFFRKTKIKYEVANSNVLLEKQQDISSLMGGRANLKERSTHKFISGQPLND